MKLSDLLGKKIMLWGAGRETVALVDAVERRAIDCEFTRTVIEHRTGSLAEHRLGKLMPVTRHGAKRASLEADVVVRSPWVQTTRGALSEARENGTTVTTSTSLWLCEHDDTPLLAVTGTKGKTTTTLMVAHMLRELGETVIVGGNIGNALCGIDDHEVLRADRIVAELSSFQAADLMRAPEVYVLTNLYGDHEGWHGSRSAYHGDKLRPLTLGGTEHVVHNPDQAPLGMLEHGATVHEFGAAPGHFPSLAMRGRHAQTNAAGALAAIQACGYDLCDSEADQLLESFVAPPARLETIAEDSGISWVCDVHGSCPEAASAVLESFDGPVTLLLGGAAVRTGLEPVAGALRSHGDAKVVAYDEAAPAIAAMLSAGGLHRDCVIERPDLRTAVDAAAEFAQDGETVVAMGLARPPHGLSFTELGVEFGALVRATVQREENLSLAP